MASSDEVQELLKQRERELQVAADIAELRKDLAAAREETKHIASKVELIRTEIVGNGNSDGLRATVRNHDRVVRKMSKLVWIIATTVAGGVGTLIWTKLST